MKSWKKTNSLKLLPCTWKRSALQSNPTWYSSITTQAILIFTLFPPIFKRMKEESRFTTSKKNSPQQQEKKSQLNLIKKSSESLSKIKAQRVVDKKVKKLNYF